MTPYFTLKEKSRKKKVYQILSLPPPLYLFLFSALSPFLVPRPHTHEHTYVGFERKATTLSKRAIYYQRYGHSLLEQTLKLLNIKFKGPCRYLRELRAEEQRTSEGAPFCLASSLYHLPHFIFVAFLVPWDRNHYLQISLQAYGLCATSNKQALKQFCPFFSFTQHHSSVPSTGQALF